jgi:hypothetical protein
VSDAAPTLRQQVLYLWLAEGALDARTVAWAFHDGSDGRGPALPASDPPYEHGAAALRDGWLLMQTPVIAPLAEGREHEPAYLSYEFVFERRVDCI